MNAKDESTTPLLQTTDKPQLINGMVRRASDEEPHHNGTNGLVKIDIEKYYRDEYRLPKERHKTALAGLWYFLSGVLNTSSVAMVHDMTPDRSQVKPLHDIVLDRVDPHDSAQDVSEAILMVCIFTCILVVILHKHRWIVLRRTLLILGALYIMRFISTLLTVLPVSSSIHHCSPQSNNTTPKVVLTRMFFMLTGFGMRLGQRPFSQCGDYIYSGHTVNLVLTYLIICEYSPKHWVVLHWVAWLLSMSGAALLLYAGVHYTIDVVAAYYVTTRVFWIYHTMANTPVLKSQGSQNHISRVWWFRVFRYMEGNVVGTLPHQYESPLPAALRWPQEVWKKMVKWSGCISS